jgi:mannitol/fructose-specific phosphotransferase system IIA component
MFVSTIADSESEHLQIIPEYTRVLRITSSLNQLTVN